MTVQRLIDTQQGTVPAHISPDATIADVLGVLATQNVGALVVLGKDDTVEGIISERDIVRGLKSSGAALLNSKVTELMTKDVITCVPDDKAAAIMEIMVSKHLRHLPVIKDGKFISMVSIRNLLQLRLAELATEAEDMRSYIAGRM